MSNNNKKISPQKQEILELGSRPIKIKCPKCHFMIKTETKSRPSKMAWMAGLRMCLAG